MTKALCRFGPLLPKLTACTRRTGLQAFSIALILATLQGCADHQSAAGDAARYLWNGHTSQNNAAPKLDARWRYLRVTVGESLIWMVLGYMDVDASGRPVEVWYSRENEVLRLQNGRLIGLSGTPVEWQAAHWMPINPQWPDINQTMHWQLQVNERTGSVDRAGRSHSWKVQRIAAPANSAISQVSSADLVWYELTPDQPQRLPNPRFARRPTESDPTYGEQCLSAQLCLTWQYWPPRP